MKNVQKTNEICYCLGGGGGGNFPPKDHEKNTGHPSTADEAWNGPNMICAVGDFASHLGLGKCSSVIICSFIYQNLCMYEILIYRWCA